MPSEDEIANQQVLLSTYRRTLAHYLKQKAELGSAYVPPGVSSGINEACSNIQRIKWILREWHVPVEDLPDDNEVSQSLSHRPLRSATPIDRKKLRQILTEYFNEDELRELCFDINIDYENLSAGSKAGKARELVAFAERHGKTQELVEQVRTLRPGASW